MDGGPEKVCHLVLVVVRRGQVASGKGTISITPSTKRIWRISLADNRLSPTSSKPTSILASRQEVQHVPERGDELSPGVARMSSLLLRSRWLKHTRASHVHLS